MTSRVSERRERRGLEHINTPVHVCLHQGTTGLLAIPSLGFSMSAASWGATGTPCVFFLFVLCMRVQVSECTHACTCGRRPGESVRCDFQLLPSLKKKQMSSISKALKHFTLIFTCARGFGCMRVCALYGCLVLELQQAGVSCRVLCRSSQCC